MKKKKEDLTHCHICGEASFKATGVFIAGEFHPLCALHGDQVADDLVTMLQGWLHDRPVKPTEKKGESQ